MRTSASGNTTEPWSRPSVTSLRWSDAILRCDWTIALRTTGFDATGDTARVTSGVRMRSPMATPSTISSTLSRDRSTSRQPGRIVPSTKAPLETQSATRSIMGAAR
jgi:hypothetical protein